MLAALQIMVVMVDTENIEYRIIEARVMGFGSIPYTSGMPLRELFNFSELWFSPAHRAEVRSGQAHDQVIQLLSLFPYL